MRVCPVSHHPVAAREEAALKLISNRETVLRDVTNAAPRTQRDLERLAMFDVALVDQVLRELTRRLLGDRPGLAAIEERLDAAEPPARAKVWAKTTRYLEGRLQASANDCPGRKADMSEPAAAAMRAVLSEVGAHAQQAWADAEPDAKP